MREIRTPWVVPYSSWLCLLLLVSCCDGNKNGTPVDVKPIAKPTQVTSSQVDPSKNVLQMPKPLGGQLAAQEVTFLTSDHQTLSGMWRAGKASAWPVVVLVHRGGSSREEWDPLLPVIEPLQIQILTFDVRGHGRSVPITAKGPDFFKTPKAKAAQMALDVDAALSWIRATTQNNNPVLVIGSSFGATLAVLAAERVDRVVGLGLISPGAAIRGVDIYIPFTRLAPRPTLLIGATSDTIANEPIDIIGKIAKQNATIHRVLGQAHGAEQLARSAPEMWGWVHDWIQQVITHLPPSGPPAVVKKVPPNSKSRLKSRGP
jgi:pimeloyl-ACP methyl ester carboxylesterase